MNIVLQLFISIAFIQCYTTVPFTNDTVNESPNDDIDLDPEEEPDFFEGDMRFDDGDNETRISPRNVLIKESRRWPNGIVYYKIDDAFEQKYSDYIHGAMRHIEKVSCVRFFPAVVGETAHYVQIIAGKAGCSSHVGYNAKIQELKLEVEQLDHGCFRNGTIQHELLHTLGMHHQQSVTNRDEYITIYLDNIRAGQEKQFQKYNSSYVSNLGLTYDYNSVMHYHSTAFSKGRTLSTIQPIYASPKDIGQRIAMSEMDIKKINIMYDCKKPMYNN